MAAQETISALKAKVQDELTKTDLVKAELEAEVALHDQLAIEVDAEKSAERLAGIEEGKAMIQLPDPTDPAAQYTQEQMNAAVNAGQELVKSELQPQIDAGLASIAALGVQLADLQSQLDAEKAKSASAEQSLADYQAKVQAELDEAKSDLA